MFRDSRICALDLGFSCYFSGCGDQTCENQSDKFIKTSAFA